MSDNLYPAKNEKKNKKKNPHHFNIQFDKLLSLHSNLTLVTFEPFPKIAIF